MSSSGYGQAPKKETVYGGPAPTPKQGTVYNGPSIQTAGGTVYNGPSIGTAGGTVYNGPSVGGTVYNGPSVGGTVYGGPGTRAATSRPVAGPSSAAGSAGGTKAGRFFYAIAALTVLRTVLIFAGVQTSTANAPATSGSAAQSILIVNGLVAAVFALIGFFTQAGSKIAFLIGMLLYAADTLFLIVSNPASHVVAIVIHTVILLGLFRSYRELPE